MSETFKRFGGYVSSSGTVYNLATSGTNDIAIMLSCTVANITSSDVTAQVSIWKNGNVESILINDATIPPGTALELVQNKIILESGEQLRVSTNSNNNLSATIAVLQITS